MANPTYPPTRKEKDRSKYTTITIDVETLSNLRIIKAYANVDMKTLISDFAKKELNRMGVASVSDRLGA
jgi:hypothetical protein